MTEKEEHARQADDPWRFVLWLGVGADFVGHELGEEVLERYLKACGEVFARPQLELGGVKLMKRLARSDPKELMEDGERIVVRRRECVTGGRMEREGITRKLAQGKYKGMTPYCVHCPLWWSKLAKEWYNLDIEFSYADGGRGCTWTYHKGK